MLVVAERLDASNQTWYKNFALQPVVILEMQEEAMRIRPTKIARIVSGQPENTGFISLRPYRTIQAQILATSI